MRRINGQRDGGAGAESKVRIEPGSNLKIRAHSGETIAHVSDVQLQSSVKGIHPVSTQLQWKIEIKPNQLFMCEFNVNVNYTVNLQSERRVKLDYVSLSNLIHIIMQSTVK